MGVGLFLSQILHFVKNKINRLGSRGKNEDVNFQESIVVQKVIEK